MQNKIYLVAQREYLSIIRKPSFWISTLFFPLFIGGITILSGLSSTAAEQAIIEQAKQFDTILILDESKLLNTASLSAGTESAYHLVESKQAGLDAMAQSKADLFVYVPQDVLTNKKLELYTQDRGLFANLGLDTFAKQLIQQSILGQLPQPELVAAFNQEYQVDITAYKDGASSTVSLNNLIVPGVSIGLYFTLVFFAASFLLRSVSEEKENRMIEVVLSTLSSRQLIWGKIAGQLGIVFTQIFILGSLSLIVLSLLGTKLPIAIPWETISPIQILFAIFCIITGFLITAGVMVGCAAAMPTYRDAQGLSSIFIILSILPVYVAGIIVTQPAGAVAVATSYFPLTAPMILLFRSAMGALPPVEVVLGIVCLIVYVMISFWLAFKLFEFGSLEYNRSISLKGFLRRG